jgi:hypothetical protein
LLSTSLWKLFAKQTHLELFVSVREET